jgi:hypothetical protein
VRLHACATTASTTETVLSPEERTMRHPTRRHHSALILALTLVVQAACASSGAAGASSRYDQVSTKGVYYGESAAPSGVVANPIGLPMLRNTSHLITSRQIADVRASTAYDAVTRLRPQLMQAARGTRAMDGRAPRPRVYIDGAFQGELDVLHSISAPAVYDMRYVTPIDASSWLGAGHEGGALFVRLRRTW